MPSNWPISLLVRPWQMCRATSRSRRESPGWRGLGVTASATRSTKIPFYGEGVELGDMVQAVLGHDVAAVFARGQGADVQMPGNRPAIEPLAD